MAGKNIIWLASYPKSGNTWFRAFLTALQNGGAVDINNLGTSGIFSSKETFESVCDMDTDELTALEIQAYNRQVYRYISDNCVGKRFIKIHDAFTCDESGIPLIPEDVTQCAVYFVRNPLDVAVSFANHNNQPVAKTIEKFINNPEGALSGSPHQSQFPQPLLDWSRHAESWLRQPSFPVYMLRYEDMLADTFNVFKDIVSKIELIYTDDDIRAAIDASSFEALRRQEDEKGFREKMPKSPRFFKAGITGYWKQVLTEEQADHIWQYHEGMMKELDYTL